MLKAYLISNLKILSFQNTTHILALKLLWQYKKSQAATMQRLDNKILRLLHNDEVCQHFSNNIPYYLRSLANAIPRKDLVVITKSFFNFSVPNSTKKEYSPSIKFDKSNDFTY